MLKLHVKHVGDEFVGAHSPCLTFLPSITGQLKKESQRFHHGL